MIKKLLTLSVAGMMVLSIVGLTLSAPVSAMKPANPGNSQQAHEAHKKNYEAQVVETDDDTKQTPVHDDQPVKQAHTVSETKQAPVQKQQKESDHKVTICHRTHSAKNPYVKITVDSHAVDGEAGTSGNKADHFGEHRGPVATSYVVASQFKKSHTEWGDIIPPVAPHNGLNWTAEGKAIFDNGCKFATPEVPETTCEDAVVPGDDCVLSENTDEPAVLPNLLPHTGGDMTALTLLLIAGISALVGLTTSAARLVQSRRM